jgi:hypothetical protein
MFYLADFFKAYTVRFGSIIPFFVSTVKGGLVLSLFCSGFPRPFRYLVDIGVA